MEDWGERLTAIASLVLRLSCWVFLRWIPGHHFPPFAYTSFAVWVVAFVRQCRAVHPYEVLSEVAVVVKEPDSANGTPEEDYELIEGAEDGPLKELDAEENIVLKLKPPKVVWTLLSGVPSPSSWGWTLVTATVNVALIIMFTDLMFTSHWFYQSSDLSFARIGYVSPHRAELFIREPRAEQLPISVSIKDSRNVDFQSVGKISRVGETTDFTARVSLTGLESDRRYQNQLSNNHTGSFSTAPLIGATPARTPGKFVFLHSSCLKARFPYVPFTHPLEIPGLRHLAKWIPELKAQFMLFLGDFEYQDVPMRFGSEKEDYRREYRMVYSSPGWSSATVDLPWIHVYDDHEIANDWDNGTGGVFPAAFDAFTVYQKVVNPPSYRPEKEHNSWFAFDQGPASFFMLDTRRYRSSNFAPDAGKTMLGARQLKDLLYWLRKTPENGIRFKAVVTSVPFTKNWRLDGNDTWGAFLNERQQILEAMWDCTARGIGVVVLSGDRHEFAATRFSPPEGSERGRHPVVEFSTSPLSMFYLPIRTYWPRDGEDEMIKYIPKGNSKFGAVEITAPAADQPSRLHYRLIVDGKEAWTYAMLSPPARKSSGWSSLWT